MAVRALGGAIRLDVRFACSLLAAKHETAISEHKHQSRVLATDDKAVGDRRENAEPLVHAAEGLRVTLGRLITSVVWISLPLLAAACGYPRTASGERTPRPEILRRDGVSPSSAP